MANKGLCKFEPADINACGSEWQEYKRLFEIHLDAKGLYGAEGRQKVGQLLKCMGQQSIAIYDSFTWAPAVPAILADQTNSIAAQAEIPGEDKYDLQTVLMPILEYTGTEVSRGKNFLAVPEVLIKAYKILLLS